MNKTNIMNEQQLPLREAFCANCQAVTEHTVQMESMRGDYVFTCTHCERAIKFPTGVSEDELIAHVDNHKAANVGQVSLEDSQAVLDRFLAKTAKPSDSEEEAQETEQEEEAE
jgi:hypothetical protein